jgi:hypothetical protein
MTEDGYERKKQLHAVAFRATKVRRRFGKVCRISHVRKRIVFIGSPSCDVKIHFSNSHLGFARECAPLLLSSTPFESLTFLYRSTHEAGTAV